MDISAQQLACFHLVQACKQAIESLACSTAEPERKLRALITLRAIEADWYEALDQVTSAARRRRPTFTPR